MNNFNRAFTELLGNEGGYSNNPNDPGGETNWGITLAVARANGYVGAMKDMDQSFAKRIYAMGFSLFISHTSSIDSIRHSNAHTFRRFAVARNPHKSRRIPVAISLRHR